MNGKNENENVNVNINVSTYQFQGPVDKLLASWLNFSF
jgi:hypothetical protein